MYNCSAKCCENPHYTLNDVQSCVDICSMPVNRSQESMQQEVTRYQVNSHIIRCYLPMLKWMHIQMHDPLEVFNFIIVSNL